MSYFTKEVERAIALMLEHGYNGEEARDLGGIDARDVAFAIDLIEVHPRASLLEHVNLDLGIGRVERLYGERVVAVIFDEDGHVIDHTFNWEAAQSFALHDDGRVLAVADDGGMTREEIQRLCNAEADRRRDCFG